MSDEMKNSRFTYLSAEEQRALKAPSDIKGFLGFI